MPLNNLRRLLEVLRSTPLDIGTLHEFIKLGDIALALKMLQEKRSLEVPPGKVV
jgi:hypothetical protein